MSLCLFSRVNDKMHYKEWERNRNSNRASQGEWKVWVPLGKFLQGISKMTWNWGDEGNVCIFFYLYVVGFWEWILSCLLYMNCKDHICVENLLYSVLQSCIFQAEVVLFWCVRNEYLVKIASISLTTGDLDFLRNYHLSWNITSILCLLGY